MLASGGEVYYSEILQMAESRENKPNKSRALLFYCIGNVSIRK